MRSIFSLFGLRIESCFPFIFFIYFNVHLFFGGAGYHSPHGIRLELRRSGSAARAFSLLSLSPAREISVYFSVDIWAVPADKRLGITLL